MWDVTPNQHPQHPWKPQEHPQMRIKDFNSEHSYLSSLTCNVHVRVHIGRSSDRSYPPILTSSGQEWQFQVSYKQINWQIYTPYWHLVAKNDNFRFHISRSTGRSKPPHTQMHYGDIYDGMCLTAILDSSRKVWNFLLFLNNLGSKQSVSIVELCKM